jgi:hypothetical protein
VAIGRWLGAGDKIGFRLSQHLLVWAFLPVPAFHASVIWGGSITSPVRWAHFHYMVDSNGQVTEARRLPYPGPST